jgi:DNA-binding SARP family transcriptional activator
MAQSFGSLVPHLSVLGGFALTVGGSGIGMHSSGERLLAFLAVHGRQRPVRRTALAEQLWCESEPARAAASLRSVLWRLPRPTGQPLVEATKGGLRLVDEMQVDLWRAEDHAQSVIADSELSEADAAVLSGDLLPDWPDDWLLVEREAFRQTRLHALERSSERMRERGRFPAALRAALAAVQCEPLRESAHRAVIAVHLAEGNHAEALRQYQGFRRLLARELGLPPSPVIRTLVAPLLGRPVERPPGPRRTQR